MSEVSLPEGPFGEFTGYYAAAARPGPVMEVTAIHHRNDPILLGSPPMKPPRFHFGLPFRAATIWSNLEAAGVTDVAGVWQHVSQLMTVVALRQRYDGHAKRAALVAAAHSYMARLVVVVDDDIDPSNLADVMWAVATRCEPSENIDILRNAWSSALDPRIPPQDKERGVTSHSKAIIEACRPFSWTRQIPADLRRCRGRCPGDRGEMGQCAGRHNRTLSISVRQTPGNSSLHRIRCIQAVDQRGAVKRISCAAPFFRHAPQLVEVLAADHRIFFLQRLLVLDRLRLDEIDLRLAALARVAVEHARIGAAIPDAGKLIGKIDRVVDAAVHAHAADRIVDVRAVTGKQHAALVEGRGDTLVNRIKRVIRNVEIAALVVNACNRRWIASMRSASSSVSPDGTGMMPRQYPGGPLPFTLNRLSHSSGSEK